MTTKEQKRRWYLAHRALSIKRAKQYRLDRPEWDKKVNLNSNRSEFNKTWRKRNPEKAKSIAEHNSLNRRFKKYGLTLDQYHALAEKQDFRCAICGVVPDDNYGGLHDGFHIDHSHVSGGVRGLLCKHCNVGIGMLKDSEKVLQAAIKYLRCNKQHDVPSVSKAMLNNVTN